MTSPRLYTLHGETHTLTGWARKIGVDPSTLRNRLAKDWPLEAALTRPPVPPSERPRKATAANARRRPAPIAPPPPPPAGSDLLAQLQADREQLRHRLAVVEDEITTLTRGG